MPAAPIEAASDAHAYEIVALRDRLAHWQQVRAIEQWTPGEVTVEQVSGQISAEEWFVVLEQGAVCAAVRICTSDPQIWPDREESGYIHGLMVARGGVPGTGSWMLGWAEQRIASAGLGRVRLDCVATNDRLRAYYEARGYEQRGVASFSLSSTWVSVMRYEKHVAT